MEFQPREYIFSLILVENKNKIIDFLGTGFFVRNDGTFLTARHVIDIDWSKLDKMKVEIMGAIGSVDKTFAFFKVGNIEHHPKGLDVSLGKLVLNFDCKFFKLAERREMHLGTEVFTWGFGDTKTEDLGSAAKNIKLHPRFFKGYICSRIPDFEWMGTKTPSYELPFPILKGASGSPLLSNIQDGETKLIGLVYGTHTSETSTEKSQETSEYEVVKGDEKIKTIKTQYYHEYFQMGLSHTIDTLHELDFDTFKTAKSNM